MIYTLIKLKSCKVPYYSQNLFHKSLFLKSIIALENSWPNSADRGFDESLEVVHVNGKNVFWGGRNVKYWP